VITMRWGEGRRALAELCAGVAACTFGAGSLAGCGYRDICYDELMCPGPPEGALEEPEATNERCPADLATAPAVDGCGVFVSPKGSDANPGTRSKPFGTLQYAIRVAEGRPSKRVYACEGEFREAVTLPVGVDLWGSRDCAQGAWSFQGQASPTTVAPLAGVPLRVVANSKERSSAICGFKLQAADGSAPDGKSSVAMIAQELTVVTLLDSMVEAGNGWPGEAGADAPRVPSPHGIPGNPGTDACSADLVPGAAPVTTECDLGPPSSGGRGGDATAAAGGDGEDGEPASGLGGTRYGQGGRGGSTLACEAGQDGLEGGSGRAGRGGAGLGVLSSDGWRGANGQAGAPGTVGQGGGGGGGLAGRGICEAGERGGLPGGSGGSGGCGGRAGAGGRYGGASLGILAVDATVRVVATYIETKKGGAGGKGGRRQPGGFGGAGGAGGRYMGASRWACDGGSGGKGGDGGPGGGGAGGPSIGIASWHSTIEKDATVKFTVGQGGLGGESGSELLDAGAGTNGVAGPLWDIDGDVLPEDPPR
jgi:hypothetical protein